VQDLDVVGVHTEAVGDDLRPGGLVALPVRGVPVTTSTLPLVVMRTVACSQPPDCSRTPAATFDGDSPPDSVKLPNPIPICTGSEEERRRACSARSSS
jgi:hypothetical protein